MIPRPVLAAAAAVVAAGALAQSSGIATRCNPMDIDYRYNFEQLNEGISYRSAADAVVVPHGGEYYLFATISGGYWRSRDLVHWSFVTPSMWPMEDVCAPAALSVDGTLYLYQSTFEQRPILCTRAPAAGRLEFFNRLMPPLPGQPPRQLGPWDPDIFHDPDTGRWFMYWGSSDTYPIWGIELDFARRLAPVGEPVELIRADPARHGWERFGRDHREPRAPFVEGAHMTKHGGVYYLQYAAPGTEYNVYADGVYVGSGPLGPFTYAPYSPVSYRPGGFATGAGHGSTFADRFGNWFHTGTPWIGVNWNFERRLAMFPAGFDPTGRMFVDTRFGDLPHRVPAGRWSSPDELFTGWMLLSYRKGATATSALPDHPAAALTDEDPRTFWVAAAATAEPRAAVDLGRELEVRAVQVDFADYRSGVFAGGADVYTQFRLSASRDGATWRRIADLTAERRDRPNAYVELPHPVRARFVRYEHVHVGAANLAISDIRVFGRGGGAPPATTEGLAVRRDADPRNAFVSWRAVPGAVGYNVRWGVAADALHHTWQRWADEGTELEVRALNLGQSYAFAVEAFDENGVSPLSAAVTCR